MKRSPLPLPVDGLLGVTLRWDSDRLIDGEGEKWADAENFPLRRLRDGVFVGVRNGDEHETKALLRFREGLGGVFAEGN